MNVDYNLKTFLKMFYLDSNIPMCLYDNNQLIYCVPKITDLKPIPDKYKKILMEQSEQISYYSTDYGTYFSALKIKHKHNLLLLMGPVNNIPYTSSDLHFLYNDYTVPQDKREDFQHFIGRIPPISLTSLLAKMIFIHYCLNKEISTLQDFFPYNNSSGYNELIIGNKEIYQTKESFSHNKSYELETLTLNLVRTGNPDGFKQLDVNDSKFNTGVTGSTALQQLRNNVIITTTLSTRAAIDGGLDYDTAYQLSDDFIRSAERIQKAEDLYDLLQKIGYTFAQKVQEVQIPLSANDIIQKAIRFIQQNTNQHISVQQVSEYVGFSRSYFSTYFKQELGFSISAFILRCKLEESKRLLKYTNKSLSIISSYLCFSSQSHFQTAFKKQYGLTPTQYRRDSDF